MANPKDFAYKELEQLSGTQAKGFVQKSKI